MSTEGAVVFVRSKVVKGHTYHQVVQGYREGAKVRHRTVVSLGRSPTPKEAAAVGRKAVKRCERRLVEITPLVTLPRWAKEAERLRARVDALTQRIARLEEVDRLLD